MKRKTFSPKEQAKQAREIHSGVDPDEGINACLGMGFVVTVMACIAGLVWWFMV